MQSTAHSLKSDHTVNCKLVVQYKMQNLIELCKLEAVPE